MASDEGLAESWMDLEGLTMLSFHPGLILLGAVGATAWPAARERQGLMCSEEAHVDHSGGQVEASWEEDESRSRVTS